MSFIITRKIILNTNNFKPNDKIIIKQGCIGTVKLIVIFNDKGGLLELPAGTIAKFKMSKPGKVPVFDDVDVIGNEVHILITKGMQDFTGDAQCEIVLISGGNPFTSATFTVTVDGSVYSDKVIENLPEYTSVIEALVKVEAAGGIADSAYETAMEAQTILWSAEDELNKFVADKNTALLQVDEATQSANAAADLANSKASAAETATQNANTAKQGAETAAEKANTAATNAENKIADVETRFQTLTTEQQQDAEVIEARKGKASLKAKMDDLDSQLADNAQQLANFETEIETNYAKKSEVTNVMTPRGTIAYAELPTIGNTVGDYYYCPDGDGTHGAGNYVWNGTSWYFGGTGDEGYSKLNDGLKELYNEKNVYDSSYDSTLGQIHKAGFLSGAHTGNRITVEANGNVAFTIDAPLVEGNKYNLVLAMRDATHYAQITSTNGSSQTGNYKSATFNRDNVYVEEITAASGYLEIYVVSGSAFTLSMDLALYDITNLSQEEISEINFSVFEEVIFVTSNGIVAELKKDVDEMKPNAISRYKNKKVVSYGDSTVEQNRWQPYLVSELGITHVNKGLGGSTVSDTVNGMCTDARVNTIPSDTDVLLFLGGINDWMNDIPMGNMSYTNTDTSTFIGSLNVMFQKIITRIPTARVVSLGTTCAKLLWFPSWDNGIYNTHNLSAQDYNDAIGTVSKWYGIPFVDIYHNAGWNFVNIETYVQNDGNLIHFNTNCGGKRVAECVTGTLKRIEPVIT